MEGLHGGKEGRPLGLRHVALRIVDALAALDRGRDVAFEISAAALWILENGRWRMG